jgi:hypothetical protein
MLSIRSEKTRHIELHNEKVVVFLVLLKQKYPITKMQCRPKDIGFVFHDGFNLEICHTQAWKNILQIV